MEKVEGKAGSAFRPATNAPVAALLEALSLVLALYTPKTTEIRDDDVEELAECSAPHVACRNISRPFPRPMRPP